MLSTVSSLQGRQLNRDPLQQWCSQAKFYKKKPGLRESIQKSSLAPKDEEFFSYVETLLSGMCLPCHDVPSGES